MRSNPARLIVTAALALPLALTAACGSDSFEGDSGSGSDAGPVTVVSQKFTEAEVMTELYKAVLEDAGYKVSTKNFTTRDIYIKALSSGDVQIAADYLSSMTEELNRRANGKDAEPVASPDADATVAKLDELGKDVGLEALDPAKAEDANGFVVTKKVSDSKGVTKLSDLTKLGSSITLAAASDCPDRPECALGLKSVYGVTVSKVEPLGFGSPETKDAVKNGEVDLGEVGTTDATLESNGLVLLDDDKDWQNAENLVPVVNSEWLKKNDKAAKALNELSATLTTDDLATLIGKVDTEREVPVDVATAYLKDKGLT
jgi:osmoprotectant transport system substrate-binding protein